MVHRGGNLFIQSILLGSLPSYAEERSDVFDMSLEQLLYVSVASSEPERIIHTPGIVSRYDMDVMARLGLHNLLDVLQFIPGVLVQRSVTGSLHIQMRGLSDTNNQKVLFLLNDTPYWMPAHADIPLLGIPVESISHVEVIRGPGSVVYGTNASAGVIRVVTKDSGASSAGFFVASHQRKNAASHHIEELSEGFVSLSLEVQSDEGYQGRVDKVFEFDGLGFSPTNSGSFRYKEEMRSVLLSAEYHSTRFTAHAFESAMNSVSFSGLGSGEETQQVGYLAAIEHSAKFDFLEVKFFSELNRYERTIVIDNLASIFDVGGPSAEFSFDGHGTSNYRWRNGVHFSYPLSERLNVYAGVEHERRNTGAYRLTDSLGGAGVSTYFSPGESFIDVFPEGRLEELSQFIQLDYQLKDWRFVVGGRYTDNQRYGSELTPRASAMYRWTDEDSIKLMYSQGFNSPTYVQDIDIDAFNNPVDSNLSAEQVSTIDLAYSYENEAHFFVANLYYTEIDNLIGVEEFDPGVPANAASAFYRSGVELDYQWQGAFSTLFANASWLKQGGDDNGIDLLAAEAPEWMMTAGGSYALSAEHSVGLSQDWIGDRAGMNPSHTVNASYQYERGPTVLYATVRNVFDRRNMTPDGQYAVPMDVQQMDRMNFMVGYRYSY